MSWQQKAAAKRAASLNQIPNDWRLPDAPRPKDVRSIPATCGILTPRELIITEEDEADVLLKRIAAAEWSAEEVALAYCKRAAIAQQLVRSPRFAQKFLTVMRLFQTTCITEPLFDRALSRARGLDTHLRTTGAVIGPLHGLPVSLKEQFDIEGVESTMGEPNFTLRSYSTMVTPLR